MTSTEEKRSVCRRRQGVQGSSPKNPTLIKLLEVINRTKETPRRFLATTLKSLKRSVPSGLDVILVLVMQKAKMPGLT